MSSPLESRPNESPFRTSRLLPRVAISSAISAYALIIFGSHVRVSDSGMGCPDWPLCSGQVGPIYEFHALMEQTHRYIAAVVTVLAIATALLALQARSRATAMATSASTATPGLASARATTSGAGATQAPTATTTSTPTPISAVGPALFTVGVILVQIALGALTVLTSNAAPTVAAHLIAGVAMLCGATAAAVCTLVPASATPAPQRPNVDGGPVGRLGRLGRLGRVGWIAIGAAGVLFVSGSLVVNAEAEQACASLPLCPTGQPGDLVWPHLLHRAIAVLAAIALLTFSSHAWRRWSEIRGARPLAAGLAALVVATATLGAFSALLFAPADLQDLHLAGAAAVLAISAALATLGWLTYADDPGVGLSDGFGDGSAADRPIQPQPAAR